MTEQFASHGITRLTSFEKGLEFDAQYFRETRPAWEGMSDADCHDAWLRESDASGSCSPQDHLQKLGLKLSAYPTAFPWRFYAKRRPSAGANRWTALDDFVAKGFSADEPLSFGEDALIFLVALADSYAGRLDRLTIKAFDLAMRYGDLATEELQHLADAYLREQLWTPARQIYAKILQQGEGHVWTVHNLVRASIGIDDWDGAFRALIASRTSLGHEPLWQQTVGKTIEGFFDSQLEVARTHYAERKRARGDEVIATTIAKTIDAIERLEPPLKLEQPDSGRRVILFANCDDPVSRQFRVDYKGRLLDAQGQDWTLVPMHDWDACKARLGEAGVVVFFHVPASPATLRALLAVKAAAIPTVYEVDAPSFDGECMPASYQSYRGYITPSLHDDLKLDVALYRGFASLCDIGLAPTRDIAVRLGPIVRRGVAEVLEDGATINTDEVKAARDNLIFLRSPRFLYLDADLNEAGGALLDVVRRHEAVRLTTSGYVKLAKGFDLVNKQLVELGESDDPTRYRSALAGARLNLIFDAFPGDSGTAGLAWLEAACLGVPSIMSAPSAAAAGLVDGEHCLIARNPDDWRECLERLVTDPVLAASIGERAKTKVASERDVRSLATVLDRVLNAARDGAARW